MWEKDFRSILNDISGVALSKISWGLLPTNANYPHLSIHLVTEVGEYTFSGRTKARMALVQVDIWNTDIITLWEIRDAIIAGIDDYTNSIYPSIDNIQIDAIRQDDDNDAAQTVYRYMLDFKVFYSN